MANPRAPYNDSDQEANSLNTDERGVHRLTTEVKDRVSAKEDGAFPTRADRETRHELDQESWKGEISRQDQLRRVSRCDWPTMDDRV
jgi:hypothetical protein